VEHIIVLGHTGCGGIEALMAGEGITQHQYEFIGAWVSIARRAREQVLRELPQKPPELQARACDQAAILVSPDNLLSFPWMCECLNLRAARPIVSQLRMNCVDSAVGPERSARGALFFTLVLNIIIL
jgi:carbonic anhydrase